MHNSIMVSLRDGRIARVKIIGHHVDEQDTEIALKISVDGVAQLVRSHFSLKLHVCDLALRVNTRIRAARSMHIDFRALKQRKHARQLALHGTKLALNLPTVKISAVVLKDKF